MTTDSIISKVWSFCHTLRDDSMGYGHYLEQLTYLSFYLFGLKDDSLVDLDNLPEPADLAENIEAGLANFRTVAASLATP